MQEEAAHEQNSRRDDLHRHRHAPARRGRGIHVLVDAIVDPEADERADLVSDFEETRQDAADGDDGEFRDVTWYCGCDGAAGDAGEDAAGV